MRFVRRNWLDVNGLVVEVGFRLFEGREATSSLKDVEEMRQGEAGREGVVLYHHLVVAFWMIMQIVTAAVGIGLHAMPGRSGREWGQVVGGAIILFPGAAGLIAWGKSVLAGRIIPEEGWGQSGPTRWQLSALPRVWDGAWALALAFSVSVALWLTDH